MEKHLRMVHVHLRLREGLQNHLAQIPVDLLGVDGIVLIAPSGVHLEGEMLVGVHLVDVLYHLLLQIVIAPVLDAGPCGQMAAMPKTHFKASTASSRSNSPLASA